ncbi:MAG: hypothetical protein K2G69_02805 [Muribaculaceae bacterium]|nr:hypothetical protein [Muribaculaceae bacterium]
MMKKSLLFSAVAGMLCLGSCSQDDFENLTTDGSERNVTFTVSVDDKVGSRAFGDGTSAKNLAYAVYDVTDYNSSPQWYNPALITDKDAHTTFPDGSMSTSVTLNLVSGRQYKVAFFAYNSSGVYKFDAENKTVTLDYNQLNTGRRQTNDHDCFYKVVDINGSQVGQSQSVVLTRPVAQINVGTADLNDPAVTNVITSNFRTKFTATGYNTLHLLDGSVSGEETYTLQSAVEPITNEEAYGSFPIKGYDYLLCTYILVGNQTSVTDIKLGFCQSTTEKISRSIANVPVQRNYRTNIFGNLLTTQTDFEITKDPIIGDIDMEIWDGKPGKMPQEVDGVYTVSTPSQLAAIAQHVNSGNNMAGKIVKLDRDINLNNHNWTPIGNEKISFDGSFDGEGHTISNLSITQTDNASAAGLFGKAWGGSSSSFKNLTIDGVNIHARPKSGTAPVGSLIGTVNVGLISGITVRNVEIKSYRQSGGVVGAVYGNIENCEVENIVIDMALNKEANGTYDNGDKAGAIVGYDAEEGSNFNNNTAKNVKITGFRDLGGLFGMVYNNSYAGNSISDVTIMVTLENVPSDDLNKAKNCGPIVGRVDGATDGGNNSYEGYTLYEPATNISSAIDFSNAIAKGGYITLAADANISLTDVVTVKNPTTIYIPKGAILNVPNNGISNHSNLTLDGEGMIKSNGNVVCNENKAKLYVKSGVYECVGSGSNVYAIYNAGDLIIEDGKFINNAGAALNCNFVNGNKGTAIINGGEFSNTESGMYVANLRGNGEVTINGGKFVGNFGCVRADGGMKLTINDGTFLTNGSGNTYYALALDPSSYDSGSVVTVNGGNFWAVNSTLCFDKTKSTLNLKGGKFKSLNGCLPAEGYSSKTISENQKITVNGIEVDATYGVQITKK